MRSAGRDRAEGQREQHEAQVEHERDDDRQPVAVEREVVAVLGRRAADEHAVRCRAECGRHVVVAQAIDRGRGALVPDRRSAAARPRRYAARCCTVVRGRRSGVAGELGRAAGGAAATRGVAAAPSTTMFTGWWRRREVALQRDESLLADGVVGQRASPEAPILRPSTGTASASSSADASDRLSAGRRMTARTARPRTGPPRRSTRRRAGRSRAREGGRRGRRGPSAAPDGRSARPRSTTRADHDGAQRRGCAASCPARAASPSIASTNALPLNRTARVAVPATVRIASAVARRGGVPHAAATR